MREGIEYNGLCGSKLDGITSIVEVGWLNLGYGSRLSSFSQVDVGFCDVNVLWSFRQLE